MGRFVYAETAPFNIVVGRLPECFRDFFNGTVSPFHMNRWYCEHPDCLESFGEVMGTLLVKGLTSSSQSKIIADHKVILINESPHACAGGENYCVISENHESLNEFCRDFDYHCTVLFNRPVVMTV